MKRLIFCALVAVVLVSAFLLPFNPQPAVALSNFTVRFIDVGQGDAAWLQTPDGVDILIDGGRYGQALQYLQGSGSPDIETLIATHPDADHIGGLIPILDNLPVYEVVRDGQTHTTQTFQNFIDLIALLNIPDRLARWPDPYAWGCCITARVLSPVEPFAFSGRNENSVVLRVSHGAVDFLFTGDAGTPAESDILSRTTSIDSEILKVSHHGSSTGSSAPFLSAVQPEVAVISVGSNPYGHPDPEAINRLTSAGASVYRTDELGTITVTSNGSAYSVSPSQTITVSVQLPLILRNYSAPTPTPTPTATSTSTRTPPAPPTLTVTGTPTSTATATSTLTITSTPTSTPSATATATPSATPTDTAIPLPTSTSTPTATATLAPSDVQVNGFCSQFDAPGNDHENLNEEWVCFSNRGGDADMTNWQVEDEANHSYQFPSFMLPVGVTVRLHTGSGTDTAADLYWGSGRAIWNNSGDIVYLYDSSGNLVDEYSY